MTTTQNFKDWFKTFIEEKNLPFKLFEIEKDDTVHLIDSETVIDLIKKASEDEQSFIKTTLVQLDFVNADIHHFFEHLATCYILTNY